MLFGHGVPQRHNWVHTRRQWGTGAGSRVGLEGHETRILGLKSFKVGGGRGLLLLRVLHHLGVGRKLTQQFLLSEGKIVKNGVQILIFSHHVRRGRGRGGGGRVAQDSSRRSIAHRHAGRCFGDSLLEILDGGLGFRQFCLRLENTLFGLGDLVRHVLRGIRQRGDAQFGLLGLQSLHGFRKTGFGHVGLLLQGRVGKPRRHVDFQVSSLVGINECRKNRLQHVRLGSRQA